MTIGKILFHALWLSVAIAWLRYAIRHPRGMDGEV